MPKQTMKELQQQVKHLEEDLKRSNNGHILTDRQREFSHRVEIRALRMQISKLEYRPKRLAMLIVGPLLMFWSVLTFIVLSNVNFPDNFGSYLASWFMLIAIVLGLSGGVYLILNGIFHDPAGDLKEEDDHDDPDYS